MSSSRMYCPDCGANLDDVAVSDACPACGGPRRATEAFVESADAITMVAEVSLKITKGDQRPWTEKWLTVLHCLDALRTAYTGASGLGNVEIESRCLAFFVECNHLREWLAWDLPRGVTSADINGFFFDSDALRWCNAICNTNKHHTRTSGTTAQIRDTSISPAGNSVTIEIDWAGPNRTTVDALDLAHECIDAWRKFFKNFGITEP